MVTKPKTAQELQDKFEKDLQQLQDSCQHKISEWINIMDFHCNIISEMVRKCEICWKDLEYKTKCEACRKEYTYEKRDWSTSQLCPTCMKKGKYYCYFHKTLHNNQQGCPKCLKLFERAEKHEHNDKR